jgi:hypothetical protein
MFCLVCGKQNIAEKRAAFIEIGEYDEHTSSYEEEFGVVEHVCEDCGARFFY